MSLDLSPSARALRVHRYPFTLSDIATSATSTHPGVVADVGVPETEVRETGCGQEVASGTPTGCDA